MYALFEAEEVEELHKAARRELLASIQQPVHCSHGRWFRQSKTADVHPEQTTLPGGPSMRQEPSESMMAGRDTYIRGSGLPKPKHPDYSKISIDPKHQQTLAKIYDQAPAKDRAALPAYKQMAHDIHNQYHHLTNNLGIHVEPVDQDPYKDVSEMANDLNQNKHLSVLSTKATGKHPYFDDETNDKLRAVHDAFGHAATGRGFDPHGEEAAYLSHLNMFSPNARGALAAETRGQNSSLNQNGVFAPQKLITLPDWATEADLHRHLGYKDPPVYHNKVPSKTPSRPKEYEPKVDVGCPQCGGDTEYTHYPYEGYHCKSCNIHWGPEIDSLNEKKGQKSRYSSKNTLKKLYKVAMDPNFGSIRQAKSDNNDGMMIAIYPPKNVVEKLLYPNGESADELHITLAYLGKVGNYQENPKVILKSLIDAMSIVGGDMGPIEVNSIHTFPPKDGQYPLVAGVACTPDLQDLRDQVVGACNQTPYRVDTTFPDYKPHITLKYFDEDEPEPLIDIDPVSFVPSAISVVVAGQRQDVDIN